MFKFFKTMLSAADTRRRLEDVQTVMLSFGVQPGVDEEEADSLEDFLVSKTNQIADNEIKAMLGGATAKVLGKALTEQLDLRCSLIEGVTKALDACKSVKTPNGTTRKVQAILTEALDSQLPQAEATA